jgi:predicted phage terminase large subunit-like protein
MPKNPSGNIFKLSWINSSRYQELPHPVKETIVRGFRGSTEIIREPRELVKIMAIDCASKVSVSADYSAIICLATDFKDYYIVDCVREKLEFSDLLKKIVEVYNKHRPIRMVYCEEASAGIGIVQEMRRTTGIPIVGVVPRGSKIQRVESTSNLWESLRVHVPMTADWDVQGFIEEHTNFGGGSGHDDRVDATALGITSLQTTVEQKAKTTVTLGYADMQR